MILDIAIAIIVIFTMVTGFRNGLVYTLVRMLGWVASVIAALILFPLINGLLTEHTRLYDTLHGHLLFRFTAEATSTAHDFSAGLPDALTGLIERISETMATSAAGAVAAVCWNLIVFFLMVICLKAALLLVTMLFSKRRRGGLIGGLDGLAGLLFGGIKGMIIVFVVLAVVFPLTLLVSPALNAWLMDSLYASTYARELYHNNLILLIVNGFLRV